MNLLCFKHLITFKKLLLNFKTNLHFKKEQNELVVFKSKVPELKTFYSFKNKIKNDVVFLTLPLTYQLQTSKLLSFKNTNTFCDLEAIKIFKKYHWCFLTFEWSKNLFLTLRMNRHSHRNFNLFLAELKQIEERNTNLQEIKKEIEGVYNV